MWTHPAKRLLQSEITCSSPLTVRFIFYALNPSVLIVCVTSVAKSCLVFVTPPPPLKKKKTGWKLITLQDHCQNLEEQFLNNYLMSLFCVISRKINILDITNLESKHTEHILSDWLILEILYCARNLRISHLSAADNWLICRYPQLTVAS